MIGICIGGFCGKVFWRDTLRIVRFLFTVYDFRFTDHWEF